MSRLCPRCGFRPQDDSVARCPRDFYYFVEEADRLRAPDDPLLGTVVDGKYPLLARLGAGGQGAVYRSSKTSLHWDVAVKLIQLGSSDEPEVLEARGRFEREALILRDLRHEALPVLLDYGIEPSGRVYIVMELMKGSTLEQLLAAQSQTAQPLTTRDLLQVAVIVLDALHQVHKRGIIHRDLKPSNLMLAPRQPDSLTGKRWDLKILDFGAAHLQDGAVLTRMGGAPCTLLYASPEQLLQEPVDDSSDRYSLAALLFEALTGRPRLITPDHLSYRTRVSIEPPPHLPSAKHIPPGLDEILQRALAVSPASRYPSDRAMARALEALHLGPEADEALPPPVPWMDQLDVLDSPSNGFHPIVGWGLDLADGEPLSLSGDGVGDTLSFSSDLVQEEVHRTVRRPPAPIGKPPPAETIRLPPPSQAAEQPTSASWEEAEATNPQGLSFDPDLWPPEPTTVDPHPAPEMLVPPGPVLDARPDWRDDRLLPFEREPRAPTAPPAVPLLRPGQGQTLLFEPQPDAPVAPPLPQQQPTAPLRSRPGSRLLLVGAIAASVLVLAALVGALILLVPSSPAPKPVARPAQGDARPTAAPSLRKGQPGRKDPPARSTPETKALDPAPASAVRPREEPKASSSRRGSKSHKPVAGSATPGAVKGETEALLPLLMDGPGNKARADPPPPAPVPRPVPRPAPATP